MVRDSKGQGVDWLTITQADKSKKGASTNGKLHHVEARKEPGIGGHSCHHTNSDSADRASTSPQTLRFEQDESPNELAVSKSQRRCFIPLKRKEDIWMAGPIPSIDIHSLPEHDLVSCCCSKKLFPKVQHLSQLDHKL